MGTTPGYDAQKLGCCMFSEGKHETAQWKKKTGKKFRTKQTAGSEDYRCAILKMELIFESQGVRFLPNCFQSNDANMIGRAGCIKDIQTCTQSIQSPGQTFSCQRTYSTEHCILPETKIPSPRKSCKILHPQWWVCAIAHMNCLGRRGPLLTEFKPKYIYKPPVTQSSFGRQV